MMNTLFADVILPLPLHQRFTYRVPPAFEASIKTGIRVIVQFGKRKFFSALVYSLHNQSPDGEFEIKDIDAILDKEPIIGDKQLALWKWIADYYCCTLGEVYKAALPSGLKLESQTKISLNKEAHFSENLGDKENAVLMLLSSRKSVSVNEVNQFLGQQSSYAVLKLLLEKNAILIEEQLRDSYKPLYTTFVKLHPEVKVQDLNQVLDKLKRAKKQQQLLNVFLSVTIFADEKVPDISKKELLKRSDASEGVLKGLENKNILQAFGKETGRIERSNHHSPIIKELSPAQRKACDEIKKQFETFPTVLLHGVTSSGKTEVYIKLIKEQIDMGKQVLYMVPEIGLTSQIIHRLQKAFGDLIGIYHSKFNDAERVEIWFNVLNKKPGKNGKSFQVILGTRSALLLPFSNLGLIIVDEEHENTYKQFDPAPRYNARDMAVVMGNMHGAKVLMGTATPSFESFFNAKSKKYGMVNLNERFQSIELPEVITGNILEATRRKQMKSMFTPELFNEIEQALRNEEQVILFQNRRGFAPYIQCHACGWIPKCKHCDVSMTYHKNRSGLICHYCGHASHLPERCKECGSEDIRTRGFGTEKIEDELNILFPEAKIERMDMDTTRAKKAYDRIISRFENKQIDILVGTQMVTKGLDFDHVRIVGILNADSLLNYPDFRSYERSYQLIAQVSGRAGRKNKRGKVIIQTGHPDHPVIQDAVENNYERLFKRELNERKAFHYPPYIRLIKIVLKHKNRERLDLASYHLATALKNEFKGKVIGPEFPVISRIQTWFQKEIWIKLDRNNKIPQAKEKINQMMLHARSLPNNTNLIIYADVDPM